MNYKPPIVEPFLNFKETPDLIPNWLHQFTLAPAAHKSSLFLVSMPEFVGIYLLDGGHSD